MEKTANTKTYTSDDDIYDYVSKPFFQLCWNCKRVLLGSCEWSLNLKPIKGWDAIKDTVHGQNTYSIFSCPDYIPIKPPVIKQCYNCGQEFKSYEGNCFCSIRCYKAYSPQKFLLICQKCNHKFTSPTKDRKYCTRCLYEIRRKKKK